MLLPAEQRSRLSLRSLPALGGRPVQTLVATLGIGERGCAGLGPTIEAGAAPLPPVRVARLRGPFAAGYPIPSFSSSRVTAASRRLDAAELDAGMTNRAALAAYGLGCKTLARALWEEALSIDGRYGDAAYNLACISALAGDLIGAQAWLDLALRIDPQRYQRLMKFDPDLEALRR
jgi:tetratricopeptide (TPR) repeat protein